MSQSLKVFLACALGAFIGTLVALQINHRFWWVGLLAGFGVGYLTYEFKKVLAAVPVAWQRATSWRPDWSWWKAYLQLTITMVGVGSSMLIGLLLLIMTTDSPRRTLRMMVLEPRSVAALWFMCVLTWVFLGTLFASDLSGERVRQSARRAAYLNPLSLYLWYIPRYAVLAAWYLPTAIRFAYPRVVEAGRVIGRFAHHLFKLVHSELRLLCGVDAAIGTAVGYFFRNPLIGALAGGLFGVLNFELLSIRVFKFVPKSASLLH